MRRTCVTRLRNLHFVPRCVIRSQIDERLHNSVVWWSLVVVGLRG